MANVTQVSWIDPDEVADLVRQLQGPAQAPQPGAWELHTLPAHLEQAPQQPAFSLGPDEGTQVPSAIPAERGVEPTKNDPFPDPVDAPEIDRIRQQLRALRQKAQSAGVIPGVAAAPARSVQPEAVSQPEPTQPITPIQPMESAVFEMPTLAPEPPPVTQPVAEVHVQPQIRMLSHFTPPVAGLGDRLRSVHAWACAETNTNEVLLVDEFGDVLEGSSPQAAMIVSALMAWHSQQRVDPAVAMQEMPRIEHHLVNGRFMTILPVRSRYGAVSIALLTMGQMPELIMAQVRDALLAAIETEPS